MFEALLLVSVVLIVISQLLPEEEADPQEDKPLQRTSIKITQIHHWQHKTEQPRRKTFGRAANNPTTCKLLCDFE